MPRIVFVVCPDAQADACAAALATATVGDIDALRARYGSDSSTVTHRGAQGEVRDVANDGTDMPQKLTAIVGAHSGVWAYADTGDAGINYWPGGLPQWAEEHNLVPWSPPD